SSTWKCRVVHRERDAMTTYPPKSPPAVTSLPAKLLNMFASPAEVFDEVVVGPTRTVNWLIPLLLACLTALLVTGTFENQEQATNGVHQLLTQGKLAPTQANTLADKWRVITRVASCAAVVIGTFWSAFVLWLMGRLFLKIHFAFTKALEVAGLTTMIMTL